MKPLVVLTDKDIFPDKDFGVIDDWEERKTVKMIIFNEQNQVALVTNPIHKLYLLPGGGIDEGEDVLIAANRESIEEIKYSIISPKIIGATEEYRGRDKKHYITYGVLTDAGEPIKEDLRTENEKNLELSVKWFDVEDAKKLFGEQIEKLKNGQVEFYNTGFNLIRDKILFETAINTKNTSK